MKKLFLPVMAAVTASFFMSCGGNSPRAFAEKFMEAENKAWATGDLTGLEALEDTGVVYHLPGLELRGWKAHADYILQARPTVSNLKQDWNYLSGEGEFFALSYKSSSVLKATGDAPPMAVSNSYLFVFRLENGKIAEVWANGSTTSTP